MEPGELSDGRMLVPRCAPTAQGIPLLQHAPGKHGFVFCTGREGLVMKKTGINVPVCYRWAVPTLLWSVNETPWGTVAMLGWSGGKGSCGHSMCSAVQGTSQGHSHGI